MLDEKFGYERFNLDLPVNEKSISIYIEHIDEAINKINTNTYTDLAIITKNYKKKHLVDFSFLKKFSNLQHLDIGILVSEKSKIDNIYNCSLLSLGWLGNVKLDLKKFKNIENISIDIRYVININSVFENKKLKKLSVYNIFHQDAFNFIEYAHDLKYLKLSNIKSNILDFKNAKFTCHLMLITHSAVEIITGLGNIYCESLYIMNCNKINFFSENYYFKKIQIDMKLKDIKILLNFKGALEIFVKDLDDKSLYGLLSLNNLKHFSTENSNSKKYQPSIKDLNNMLNR